MSEQNWHRRIQELYQSEEKAMFNIALRWTKSHQEAMELVHDSFLSLWKRKESLKQEGLKSYAYTTLMNKIRNHGRFHRFKKFIGLEDPSLSLVHHGHEKGLGAEKAKEIFLVVHALPEKMKEVILLSEYSELNTKEISRVLKIPEGTVASRRNKARQLIKTKLEKLGYG